MLNKVIYYALVLIGLYTSMHYIDSQTNKRKDKTTGVYIIKVQNVGVGTGFRISYNSVLTAAHVCEVLENTVEVSISNTNEASDISYIKMYPSPTLDACVLIAKKKLKGYEFNVSTTPVELGQKLIVYGYPGAKHPIKVQSMNVISTSYISPSFYIASLAMPSSHFFVTKGELIPGMSGGPIIDEDGNVRGISARINTAKHTSYFTPTYRLDSGFR